MAVTRGYVAAMGTISDVAPARRAAKYVIIPMRPASMPLMLKMTIVLKSTVSVSLSLPVKNRYKIRVITTARLLTVTPVSGCAFVNPIFSRTGVVPQSTAVKRSSMRIFISIYVT